jgi:hypothetical protein
MRLDPLHYQALKEKKEPECIKGDVKRAKEALAAAHEGGAYRPDSDSETEEPLYGKEEILTLRRDLEDALAQKREFIKGNRRLFGVMITRLDQELRARVTDHFDYQAAESTFDLIQLHRVITDTHLLAGGARDVRTLSMHEALTRYKMDPQHDLLQHCTHLDDKISSYELMSSETMNDRTKSARLIASLPAAGYGAICSTIMAANPNVVNDYKAFKRTLLAHASSQTSVFNLMGSPPPSPGPGRTAEAGKAFNVMLTDSGAQLARHQDNNKRGREHDSPRDYGSSGRGGKRPRGGAPRPETSGKGGTNRSAVPGCHHCAGRTLEADGYKSHNADKCRSKDNNRPVIHPSAIEEQKRAAQLAGGGSVMNGGGGRGQLF